MYKSPVFQLQGNKAVAKSAHQLALIPAGAPLPKSMGRKLPRHLADHGALKGDRGARFAVHEAAARIFFGVGKASLFTPQEAADYGEACGQFLQGEGVTEIVIHIPSSFEHPAITLNFLKGMGIAGARYDELKSKAPKKSHLLKRVTVAGTGSGIPSQADLNHLKGLIEAIAFARIISELPPAIASPQGIVNLFANEADAKKIEIEVWDEKKIAKEGMGLLQAVSAASATPPRFLIARYGNQHKDGPKLFLVGKGITFDTGGINLKTGDWQMLLSMRRDMCGCAAVLGAILAIAKMGLELSVTAVTPLTTNSIGSNAVLPGDIIRSYAGKTVEIMNTDAEGRLILADAVHYAVKQEADFIIDVATLTGACAIALGAHHSGLFSNEDDFAQRVLASSSLAGEPAWPLPLSPRYGEELKSMLADMANMGRSREGGAQIGAKFIEAFVGDTTWAHLDIAGNHDISGPAAGAAPFKAAGRMVHTLVEVAKSFTT